MVIKISKVEYPGFSVKYECEVCKKQVETSNIFTCLISKKKLCRSCYKDDFCIEHYNMLSSEGKKVLKQLNKHYLGQMISIFIGSLSIIIYIIITLLLINLRLNLEYDYTLQGIIILVIIMILVFGPILIIIGLKEYRKQHIKVKMKIFE